MFHQRQQYGPIFLLFFFISLISISSCKLGEPRIFQGYAEGEYLYIASPLSGKLAELSVSRGTIVEQGAKLFSLDSTPQLAAQNEVAAKLRQAQSILEDLSKGKRPTEISSLEAQLKQAQTELQYSNKELSRKNTLLKSGGTSIEEVDRAKSARDQSRQRVAQLEAELETARLGSRVDQVTAATSAVEALEAQLSKATWELRQMHQEAPSNALVFDTLYRVGEWVPSAHPIVVLLPPQNIKIKTFLPETTISRIKARDLVQIHIDGLQEKISGEVSYISPQAEFTPPVIYSRESRSKLMFLVEIKVDTNKTSQLHPGQPVDVEFNF